jgi:hypothetical protein
MADFTRNILRKEGRPGQDPQGKVAIVAEDIEKDWPWAKIRVFLFNYSIDGNLPKQEHKDWIRAQLVPFLREVHYHLELQGCSSASGDAKYNEQLSLERVLLLKEFLVDECKLNESQVPGTRMSAIGERFADPHDDEAEQDRAVKITILPRRLSRPIPLPRPRPHSPPDLGIPWIWPKLPWLPHPGEPPGKFNHYKIRYCGGGGATFGFGVGMSQHCFEFWNQHTGEKARFFLVATSFSYSVGPPVTVTLGSDEWTHLTTAEALRLDDFDGQTVAFYGQAAGPLSWMELAFDDLHDASDRKERAKAAITTGTTLGLEMSDTRGQLRMQPGTKVIDRDFQKGPGRPSTPTLTLPSAPPG